MLKSVILVLVVMTTLLSGGPAVAQSVSLDHVDGLSAPGILELGVPITFHLRITGDTINYAGISNGFRVYSVNGVQWGGLVGDTTGTLGRAQFDGGFFINPRGVDGIGADTVGFAGFAIAEDGMPAGFDDIAYTIQIGPIDSTFAGGQICLDSSFWYPINQWKWAVPGGAVIIPAWDGPHCYLAGYEVDLPVITCPGDTTVDICAPDTFCFPFDTADADWVTVSEPAYIDNDLVCVPVLQSGSQTFTMTAGIPVYEDNCSFTVSASINEPPTVIMAADSQSLLLCDPNGTLCTAFSIYDPDGNVIDILTNIGYIHTSGHNTYVCFVPGTPGVFDVTVTATDACGASDTKTNRITVVQGELPSIECAEPVVDTLCGGQMYCVPVVISPDTARVRVSPPGLYDWETGQVCVDVQETRSFDIRVIAETECGADTCFVQLDLAVYDTPVIACSGETNVGSLCEPGVACTVIQIDNADSVHVDNGSWEAGRLCFPADTVGVYTLAISAYSWCGEDHCVLSVNVLEECAEVAATMEYDTLNVIDGHSIPGLAATVYMDVWSADYTLQEIDPTALLLNGDLPPDSASIMDSYPGFPGAVLAAYFPIYEFVDFYMPVWDTIATSWTVSGAFIDGYPFSGEGPIVLVGHVYGDVNSDGSVDISDLVYLVDYYFVGGPAPPLVAPADLDWNGTLEISDLVLLVEYMFGR